MEDVTQMMVIMKRDSSKEELTAILKRLEEIGLSGHTIVGAERTVVGVVGQVYPELADELETMPGVDDIVPISKPYKLASRQIKPEDTSIKVGPIVIGGGRTVVMAGPCAVESEEQLMVT